MSFLHIHLVRICHSSTYIWSGYVIPPHTSGPDVEKLHIRTRCMLRNDISGPDVCMWRNDISGPDGCGGMTYPDQVGVIHLVRICHSSTCIWSGYVIPPHTYISSGYVIPAHPPGPDMTIVHTDLVLIVEEIKYPDQLYVEE
jgi:hypothetical protein